VVVCMRHIQLCTCCSTLPPDIMPPNLSHLCPAPLIHAVNSCMHCVAPSLYHFCQSCRSSCTHSYLPTHCVQAPPHQYEQGFMDGFFSASLRCLSNHIPQALATTLWALAALGVSPPAPWLAAFWKVGTQSVDG
jgi:hypothetical protein